MSDLGRAQRSILHTENLWAILQKIANELQTVPGVVQFVGGGRRAQNKRSIPLETRHLGDSGNVTFWKIYVHLFYGNFGLINSSPFRFVRATGYGTGGTRANRISNAS